MGRLVPIQGEPPLGPVYRQDKQEGRGHQGHHAFRQALIEPSEGRAAGPGDQGHHPGGNPKDNGHQKSERCVFLSHAHLPEPLALLSEIIPEGFQSQASGGVQTVEQEKQDRKHDDDEGDGEFHPLQEGYLDPGLLGDEAHADEVGRGSDESPDAAHRGGIGHHEHQSRGVPGEDALLAFLCCALDRAKDAHGDGKHHRGRGGVAHPHREKTRDGPEGQHQPGRAGSDPGPGQYGQGHPAVQTLDEHGLGDEEAPDEQEDNRVCEGSQDIFGRPHRGEDAKNRPEKGRDRDGNRLRDPVDHDPGQDRG